MPDHSSALTGHFDIIIAGGGAAGCVLANRLSANPNLRILVVEAGPDAAQPSQIDPAVNDNFPTSLSHPRYRWWNTTAKLREGAAPRSHATGRNLGGGSNVNGMGADRGLPEDYENWVAAGATGWGWEEVLPHFKALENDEDFRGENAQAMHGNTGPMPVRRQPKAAWGPFNKAFAAAAERHGLPYLEDYTGEFGDGYASATTNATAQGRVSAAMAYLTPQVRARANLTLQTDTYIRRILFDGTRAIGLELRTADRVIKVFGSEIMLTCGALFSPAVLLRSGVGPAEELRALGITPVRDIPGVGKNLQNHPYLLYATYLKSAGRQSADNPYMMQNWARFSSQIAGGSAQDMHLMPFNRTAWHALGRHCGAMAVSLLSPRSRGYVRLQDADPDTPPDIQFNLFQDPVDFERLVAACKLSFELFTAPEMQAICAELFLPDPALLAQYALKTPKAARKSKLLSQLLDLPLARKIGMAKYFIDYRRLLQDDASLRDFVRKNAIVQLHDCGTCKMGRTDDSMAVVDPAGRVYGLQGLRVMDASIFPTLPRGFTHYITLMVAEKLAADYLKARHVEGVAA